MELVARLTADSKTNTLKDGRQVVNFSVAVNDNYKPKGATEQIKSTTYFNCSYWINPKVAEHLIKGTLVELHGRVSVNAWKNSEGEAKARLNFHVNSIKIHGKSFSNVSKQESTLHEIAKPIEDLPF